LGRNQEQASILSRESISVVRPWKTAFYAVLLVGFCCIAAGQVTPPESVYEKAAQEFQQGRTAEAEGTLRSILQSHPGDFSALSLIAVVLDSEGRYPEAEEFYTRALKISPRSAPVLNNLGNHYLAAGSPQKARQSFLSVVAIDPHHGNANLQLAQMSVRAGRGTTALGYLAHLEAADQAEPVAQLLMAQALVLTGKCDAAGKKLEELKQKTGQDSTFSFSIGMAYAQCKQYAPAESSFSEALKSDPTNFDVLYNLAVAARRAGDLQRAQQAFDAALGMKPNDPDALYAYGQLLIANKDFIAAASLLYRAAHSAPDRTDVLLLLAHATEELEFYDETADTYEKYLKLRPADDIARREHGFCQVRAGRLTEGIPELERYVLKHPNDPQGQYELAIGEASGSPEKALTRLDNILALNPGLVQPRYTRAVLNFQQDKLDLSLEDLLRLSKTDSRNPRLLDWEGQIYLRQGRAQDAALVLKEATDLAPHDSTLLWHYSKALQKLGRTDELNAVAADLKGVAINGGHHPRKGLFDFLDLSPEQQNARYLESIRSAVASNPNDVVLKARLAKTLLDDGNTNEATGVFQSILAEGAYSDVLRDCGKALVQHEQYQLAVEFLQKTPDAGLDLVIALFHSVGAEAGLEKLDEIPAGKRDGDYFLLRAQILDSMGKTTEAADSLNRGIRSSPTRADMYFQAAEFLIKHHDREQAADLLAQATRLVPDAAELWMTRAIALTLVRRYDEALDVLAQIESRWPEWNLAYLVNGIILESQFVHKPDEAKSMLDMAISLGARQADAYYYDALAITEITPEDLAEARKAISQAIALNPDDAAIHALAGQISLDGKDYKAAAEELQMAVRLQPTLVRAHNLLRTAYLDLGDKNKAIEEANQIERITEEKSGSDQLVSSMERLLFSVRSPDDTAASQ
jgi:predicted Zn-dependent protease